MTQSAMLDIMTFVKTANYDQLEEVARLLKQRRSVLETKNAMTLRVGDVVEFVNRGFVQGGVVTKINRKTVIVREESPSGMTTNWKVPAVMLKKTA